MLPSAWKNLGRVRRSLAVHYIRLICLRQVLHCVPGFVRLAILHSLIIILALFFFPTAPQTPPVAIPLVWGASWGAALLVYTIALKHI